MAGRNKTATETVEAEVVNEVAQPAKMEFRLINPTEDGFLRVIKWNKEELEAAVRQKIASYENVVYTEDNMKQAKADRAELNKLTKAIEERRKMVKKIINEPYDVFESELKDILALIEKPVGIIDKQVKEFEDQQKEEKKKNIQKSYDEVIGDLTEVLPFEKVFDSRYLNQTYKLATAQAEVKEKVEKVRTDLETIDSLESKYKLNAKDVYIKTLDLSKALAENKRLSDLEEKLEVEKRRKAEEEAERKRLEEERRKVEEERAKVEEDKKKALEDQRKAEQEAVFKQQESVEESVEIVSSGSENVSEDMKSVSAPVSEMGKVIQSIEHQAYEAVVDPFAPKQVEKKRYRTKFCAVGTREQLKKLIQFMKENEIEYGRIE
ncbi:MAG: DUF1351 domain-containing protein [Lachnospiraceae bacterium]|nr:DUF1351 domain-containing protein [Lachnospiraceae bacterium]